MPLKNIAYKKDGEKMKNIFKNLENVNITLYDLLNSSDVKNFDWLKQLKIYVIASPALWDRLTADVEEYYIHDIPFHLLRKKVYKVYYSENTIEVFK